MTQTLTFETAPDLAPLYVRAVVNGRSGGSVLPDVSARLTGVQVDLDHLVDYAHLCGFPVGDALPVTYPHVLGFPLQVAIMARRDFPLPLVGLVHLENTITWTRPLRLGDVLGIQVHAENLRGHRRGRLVDLVTEVSSGDEQVWRGVSTYLARGAGDPQAVTEDPPDTSAVQGLPSGPTWRLDDAVGRRYAAVSGDVNPIHLHALAARALGLKGAMAHGMYTYARVLAALGPKVPGAGRSTVWFRAPVLLPSTVLLRSSADGELAVLRPARGDGVHLVVTVRPLEQAPKQAPTRG
ncbi:MAG: MaoC family dehydratase N-terminal domain-containing protein [Actinomycetota bacterium]|nr:MaoC family dehydratase N-terminal domain-containing protein [Actinomycetota bacterium]